MKHLSSLLCSSAPVLACLSAVLPNAGWAETQRPTISVAKTEAQRVASWQPAMGEGLAQMIITELNKVGSFKVLESVALDDLREEQNLVKRGEVSEEEGVKKGLWKGADYTFKSVVTRFGAKESRFGGGGLPVRIPGLSGGGGFSANSREHEVQIDWRIIDNLTREIVPGASGNAVGIEKGGGFNFSSWRGGGFSNNREFMDSALGKATVKAVAQIIEQVKSLRLNPGARAVAAQQRETDQKAALRRVRGTVELVDGKEIWLSLGAKHGFAVGDTVKIYRPIEKKNQQGKVVLTTYKEITTLRLVKVKSEQSMGEYQGSEPIGEGWAAADPAVDIEQLD